MFIMCVTKSAQGARFGVELAFAAAAQKCQIGAVLLENEVTVQKSWNFDWPYFGLFNHIIEMFGAVIFRKLAEIC